MLNTKNLMQENPKRDWESEGEYIDRMRFMARRLKLTHVRETLLNVRASGMISPQHEYTIAAIEDLTDLVEDLI